MNFEPSSYGYMSSASQQLSTEDIPMRSFVNHSISNSSINWEGDVSPKLPFFDLANTQKKKFQSAEHKDRHSSFLIWIPGYLISQIKLLLDLFVECRRYDAY